jgi:hypothetical protein
VSDCAWWFPLDFVAKVIHEHAQVFGVDRSTQKVGWKHILSPLESELVPTGCRYYLCPPDLVLMGQIKELVWVYWNFSLNPVVVL